MHIMKADHLDTWTNLTTLTNWTTLTILTYQWLIKKIFAEFALFTWSCFLLPSKYFSDTHTSPNPVDCTAPIDSWLPCARHKLLQIITLIMIVMVAKCNLLDKWFTLTKFLRYGVFFKCRSLEQPRMRHHSFCNKLSWELNKQAVWCEDGHVDD